MLDKRGISNFKRGPIRPSEPPLTADRVPAATGGEGRARSPARSGRAVRRPIIRHRSESCSEAFGISVLGGALGKLSEDITALELVPIRLKAVNCP
jgi:hypothetical protein